MRKMMFAAIAAAAVACSAPALAETETFEFKGACIDCYGGTGYGTGQLVLKDYSYGQDINYNNFVSFHYDGTDLMPSFTVTSDPQYELYGSMQSAGPAAQDFFTSNAGYYFYSDDVGHWGLGRSGGLADFGNSSTYTRQVPAVSAAPEPAAWALMIMGVGIAGTAMRRRQRTTVTYA